LPYAQRYLNVIKKRVFQQPASMWVPLVKPFLFFRQLDQRQLFFSISPPYNNDGHYKPKAGGSGFGLPALA
jgi:hypothetical protein